MRSRGIYGSENWTGMAGVVVSGKYIRKHLENVLDYGQGRAGRVFRGALGRIQCLVGRIFVYVNTNGCGSRRPYYIP
jgi:hypothetical protein